jgi:sodium/pantothenate symporter
MTTFAFALTLCLLYAGITIGLSIIGMRKTSDLKSFALGKGDMSPALVGITMAASIASTATFVINPGFVYTHGLSAWAHFGLSATAGIVTALLVLTRGFHKIGHEVKAVTLPGWIRLRYGSRALGGAFAALSLLYISFIVLILAGSAFILSQLFELGYHTSLVVLLLFVFGYVLMGGTYAHAYTNAFQGALMVAIALVIVAVGLSTSGFGAFFDLEAVAPSAGWSSWVNSESPLYYDFFSVFVSSFVVTAALMLQPHILTKVLYLKEPSQLNKFLLVTMIVGTAFSGMLLIGFFARFEGLEVVAQDKVAIAWIASAFGPIAQSFIFVTLLAAGMSTLDGILVSLSTVVVSDLVLGFKKGGPTQDDVNKGLAWSRYALVAVGLVSLALAWDPPKLLGIFAQQGVYALVAASAAPMFLGVLRPQFKSAAVIGACSLLGVTIHFVLNLGFDVVNPSVSAAWGIIASVGLGWAASLLPAKAPEGGRIQLGTDGSKVVTPGAIGAFADGAPSAPLALVQSLADDEITEGDLAVMAATASDEQAASASMR